MTKTKSNNSDQGFSLVESLIAIVILGIVFTCGMAFYYHSSSLYSRGLHYQLATWIADSKLEELKNAGCTAAAQDAGTSVPIGPNISGTRSVHWPVNTTKGACTLATNVVVRVVWPEPSQGGDASTNCGTEPAKCSTVTLQTFIGI